MFSSLCKLYFRKCLYRLLIDRSELKTSLPLLAAAVKEWMKMSDKLEESSSAMEELHAVQQALVDAQNAPNNSVYTLSDR